jgi:hypothetical protein
MFARKAQGVEAFTGLQDIIALGFQQIVEQLHVEFIVLNDQHRLHFSYPFSASPKANRVVRHMTSADKSPIDMRENAPRRF